MNWDHSVIFEIVPKYCILDSFVDYEGYSISSKGFLPTVVDIMVIWIKFQPIPVHFSSLIPKMPMLDRIQFTLIHEPNIPGSYAILFFIASYFTFTTRHIHTWASFPLWPSHFILSGAIIICPLLFPSSILDTLQSGGVHLSVSYLFAFLYCSKCSHSKNSGMVCHSLLQWTTFCQNSPLWPSHSWVARYSMAHSFAELYKLLRHDKAVIHKGGLKP